MLKAALTLVFCSIAICLAPCEPFGLRIYYGDIVKDPASQERLVIYFNTKESCKNSYVSLITKEGFSKIACTTKSVVTSAFVNYYTANIQICSASNIPFEETISYTAYGWDKVSGLNPYAFQYQWIEIRLIDPKPIDRNLKMAVIADWGNIQNNIMRSITDDLKRVVRQKDINAVIVAGDIAYDLDSFNGKVYEDFLILMQEFSTELPFFITPGNHERRTVDAALLFNETFKVYGVDKTLATGIYFGSVFLTMFDPFETIYGLPEQISALEALKLQLQKGSKSGRFIIPFSHYPLICSSQYDECYDGFKRLNDYFDVMLSNGVSLYVGAHTHCYQRNYPYFKNHSFVPLDSPYYPTGDFMISVIEGVSGNNRSIISTMPVVREYTAKYTVNQTGFGIIQSTEGVIRYSHYSTKQGFMDQIIIQAPKKQFIAQMPRNKLKVQEQ